MHSAGVADQEIQMLETLTENLTFQAHTKYSLIAWLDKKKFLRYKMKFGKDGGLPRHNSQS